MKTENEEKVKSKLELMADSAKIPQAVKDDLLGVYTQFFDEIAIYKEQSSTIIVESVDDTEQMELASVARKEIKKMRSAVEKNRVACKSDALAYGKAVDSMAKMIKEEFIAIEYYLLTQENFAIIKEENRINKLVADRLGVFSSLDLDSFSYDFRIMTDEKYDSMLKFEITQKIEAIKSEHSERLETVVGHELNNIERLVLIEKNKKLESEIVEVKKEVVQVKEEQTKAEPIIDSNDSQIEELDVFATDKEIFEKWRQGLVNYITNNIIPITDEKLCETVDKICDVIHNEDNA